MQVLFGKCGYFTGLYRVDPGTYSCRTLLRSHKTFQIIANISALEENYHVSVHLVCRLFSKRHGEWSRRGDQQIPLLWFAIWIDTY